jgi:hypothetical protein
MSDKSIDPAQLLLGTALAALAGGVTFAFWPKNTESQPSTPAADLDTTTTASLALGAALAVGLIGYAAYRGGKGDRQPHFNALSTVSPRGLDEAFDAYVEAALWSSTGDDDQPLDKHFDKRALAYETRMSMMRDVGTFLRDNDADIDGDYSRAGHDFWLTRNGHGAGFWDGRWPEPEASRLTESAHRYGSSDLYVGDDGLLHVTPISFEMETGGMNQMRTRRGPRQVLAEVVAAA